MRLKIPASPDTVTGPNPTLGARDQPFFLPR